MDLDELIDALTSLRKHHGNVKEVFAMTKLTLENVEVKLSGWEYVTLLDQVTSVAWEKPLRERIVIYTHSMTNSGGDVTLAAARGPQVTPRVNQKPQINEKEVGREVDNEEKDTARPSVTREEENSEERKGNKWWIGNDEIDPLEGHEGDNKRVGW